MGENNPVYQDEPNSQDLIYALMGITPVQSLEISQRIIVQAISEAKNGNLAPGILLISKFTTQFPQSDENPIQLIDSHPSRQGLLLNVFRRIGL